MKAMIIIEASVFLLSALLTRFMIVVGIQDVPQARSAHAHPTPRAGGVGIVISFTIGAALFFPFSFSFTLIGMTALLLALVHFFDDLWEVSQYTRFFVQFVWAATLLALGWKVQLTSLPTCFLTSALEILLTVLGVVFTINASNFIDGLNGLLAGSAIILAVSFVGVLQNLPFEHASPLIPLTLIFIASLGGFLIFNYPHARIFMGDVGSTFIGLLISYAALATQSLLPGQTAFGIFNRGFILTLFPFSFIWFDVAFTLLRRFYLKHPLLEAHRNYLFQILHRCHYSHLFVSGLYFLGTGILGLLSIACTRYAWNFTGCFFFYLALQIIFLIKVLSLGRKHKVRF